MQKIKMLLALLSLALLSGTTTFVAAETPVSLTKSERADGRFANTRAVVQSLMESREPALSFNPNFSPEEFVAWRQRVREEMRALANHPIVADMPAPKMVAEEQRDGYRLQKWECFPLPACVSPFLVLVPDGVSAENPAPVVLCIPGSGQPKEDVVREASGNSRGGMAFQFVRAGFVAVAVDNPCIGEASDLERFSKIDRDYDYEDSSRFLLELGWSYQGYASFIDKIILDNIKARADVRSDRVVVCGFSLGTETLMILGAFDDSIFAFIYNDFLCRTRERALVMSTPGADGRRHFPNSIRHLTPGFLTQFDFPDLVAALAPRPVICTEGGMDRDFDLVRKAYALAGAPDAAVCLHQPKYADAKNRVYLEKMPYDIDRDTFFRYANVDPANHYFKGEIAIPWVKKLIETADAKSHDAAK